MALPELYKASSKDVTFKKKKKRKKINAGEFSRDIKQLRRALADLDETNVDNVAKKAIRDALAGTLVACDAARDKYLRTQGEHAAYAYAAMVTQARELFAEMRAMQSAETQVEHISLSILGPHTRMVATQLASELNEIKNLAILHCDAKTAKKMEDAIIKAAMSMGRYVKESTDNLDSKIREYLLG